MESNEEELTAAPRRRTEVLAGLYGLLLRERGMTPEQAARLVIERYPSMRSRLQQLATRKREEEVEWRSSLHP